MMGTSSVRTPVDEPEEHAQGQRPERAERQVARRAGPPVADDLGQERARRAEGGGEAERGEWRTWTVGAGWKGKTGVVARVSCLASCSSRPPGRCRPPRPYQRTRPGPPRTVPCDVSTTTGPCAASSPWPSALDAERRAPPPRPAPNAERARRRRLDAEEAEVAQERGGSGCGGWRRATPASRPRPSRRTCGRGGGGLGRVVRVGAGDRPLPDAGVMAGMSGERHPAPLVPGQVRVEPGGGPHERPR